EYINFPTNNNSSLTSTVPSTNNESNSTGSSDLNFQKNIQSIGRDFAPIFFILAIIFVLILLGLINILHNHYLFPSNNNNNRFHSGRCNNNAIYSQLTSENNFDLN
ncbi:unnamed protein product, partial [Rotaria sp. Silwood2]